jgi:hypothetical protein
LHVYFSPVTDTIDRIENNWLAVTGASHSDRWGALRTYFRFQLSPTGKIN